MTNIHSFNNFDWNRIFNNLKNIFEDTNYIHSNSFDTNRYSFIISNYEELTTFNKLIQLGLILSINDLDNTAQMGFKSDEEITYKNKLFFINEATYYFYEILKDVIEHNA